MVRNPLIKYMNRIVVLLVAALIVLPISRSSAQSYSIVDQPPGSSNFFYPNSFSAQPIQGAGGGGPLIYGHLMPNSDTVMTNIIGPDANGFPPGSQPYPCGN